MHQTMPEALEGRVTQISQKFLSLKLNTTMMKGWMYILLCADGNYYTGSTNDLERRITQHQLGGGS